MMRTTPIGRLLAVLLLFALTAASALGAPKLTFTETSFGKMSEGGRANHLEFSPDGQRAAYPAQRKDAAGKTAWVVILDGKSAEQSYEWIIGRSITFSPDSKRLAFHTQRGEKLVAVLDGVDGKEFAEIRSPRTVFSPDSKRTGLIVRPVGQEKGFVVLVDDAAVGKTYDSIHPNSIIFSPDSKRVAFVGITSAAREGGKDVPASERWVIDGQEQPAFEIVGPLVWSRDGRFAYTAQRGGKQVVILDGQEQGAYHHAGGLAFSADGKRFAYAAGDGRGESRQEFLVENGKPGPAFSAVSEPVFSPDGQRVAYAAVEKVGNDKLMHVILDGKPFGTYNAITNLAFSADSKHVAYKALDKGTRKMSLVIDGKEGPQYDVVGAFLLSPDASQVAYAARDGGEDFVVWNDRKLRGVGHLTFSPDFKHLAHHLRRAEKSYVMVDETEGNAYDGFVAGSKWTFTANNKFTLFAGRGTELLKVEVTIEGE